MGRLRTAPQHRSQRVTHGPDIPAADRAALREVDHDRLPVPGEERLVDPVEIGVDGRPDRADRRGAVGEVLGGDQVLERRESHVADVDPAEQAVPVAVVRLTAVEVVERARLRRAVRHRVHLGRRAQHLLVEVVDLAVLDLEVAPEPTAQPAPLREVRVGGVVQRGRIRT